ncbi:bifunctional UDP-N-acetylglucosamine pyrophosphorylase/glucosamine-1-phosphate N-acetyltransferase [Deinobacterium chartae]|uniref:Bifunctional protein GlmU n=2 Tax=Deinobacterium chartae TaxID=521158 RepID=A0A841I1F5_9DEIO|nr:bifunctional UDP-N-acetylglucosamine pyrophosphorylase/glucosamine-1-phosphate N-acetyltransferase [Deinobacterium chartae]
MKSKLPKVLHPLAGRSMVGYSVQRAQQLGAHNIVLVTGHGAEQVEAAFEGAGVQFVRQDRQLGTAHAFLQAAPLLRGDEILLLYGDTPLIRLETLEAMLAHHRATGAGLTILTAVLEDATGYGRIVRDERGEVAAIVEEKAASPEQRRIREFNSGVYLMDARAGKLAERITNDNPAGEYYLTDLLALYRAEGARVEAFQIDDALEVLGANDRAQLAEAEAVMRRRVALRHMRAGVTLQDPETTYIDDTVEIGRDCTLAPGVILAGHTVLGEDVTIGAYSVLRDVHVHSGASVRSHSVLEGAVLEAGADAGPFARLRPGAQLGAGAHVGNFVEVKNARLGEGTKAGHLAYLGDATLGAGVNVGAGTITANYDGVTKHPTHIQDGAFIGSNSVLVAPVTVGRGAIVAAGSAVTSDVPEGDLAVARGRQRNVEGYARRFWSQARERIASKLPVIRAWLDEN